VGLQERIDSLAPRERQLLGVLVVVFGLLVLVFFPIYVSVMLGAHRDENDQIRAVIDRIYSERDVIERHKAEKQALLAKYGTAAPPLAGYLSKLAGANSLEIPEIKDRPPIPHGKKYEEQSVEVSLKKVGMLNLAKFLEATVQGPYPISISKLNIHRRTNEPDSYDVTLAVSSFHRFPDTAEAKAGAEK
jgi:hypothetical protein